MIQGFHAGGTAARSDLHGMGAENTQHLVRESAASWSAEETDEQMAQLPSIVRVSTLS